MQDTTPFIDYLRWNKIIARHFFREEKAGKEVLLYVNGPLIAKLGEPYGVGLDEFVQAVKNGPYWVTRSGLCQKALQTFYDWRNRNLDFPPYIAYLACFVLAAGQEGDYAIHAYYPRLRGLLGEPEDSGALPSFDHMIELWLDLQKWSREDKNESLGWFEARIRGGWRKVGLPLSQTLITEDERKRLPVIFSQSGLDPADVPSPEVILRVLREFGHSVLERRTYRLLDSGSSDNIALRDALASLVRDELEAWDGVVSNGGPGDDERAGWTHIGLRICLARDSFANTVVCHVRIKTGRSFPEEGLNFVREDDTRTWYCTEIYQGWSRILSDRHSEPSADLDGVALDWINGERLVDEENQWQARLKGSATRLFIPGYFEGLPDWVEKQRLDRNTDFLIAAYEKDIETVREWGSGNCAEFEECSVIGLPMGWILFSGSGAKAPCPGIDVLAMSPTIRLLIRGGIKIGPGNSYLKFSPPYILVENGLGDEVVMLNGEELKREDEQVPVWHLPDDAPVGEGVHIEVRVGNQVYNRTLRLEEPELPLQSHYNHCRNPYGDLCQRGAGQQEACGGMVSFSPGQCIPSYPRQLPLHLSDRIVFIGERPGEICDWPHEGLPAWPSVWAIAKVARKKADAVFCGTPQQTAQGHSPGQPLDNRRLVKRWKNAVWHQRKNTRQPELGQLKDVWKKYVMVAKNV